MADRIATSGYITLGEEGEQVYIEEYRQRFEDKLIKFLDKVK
jgi:type I restriction enzyme R subunit